MKKKHLAMLLSQLTPNPKPKLRWEGYNIDAESAAEIVYAAFLHGDVKGKKVIDLGCGSGILGIAASLLGASQVLGIDIDESAIKTVIFNAEKVGVNIELVIGDIDCIIDSFDTTLMNPPFGTWRRGADIKFLKKALQISNVVYSLHKQSDSVRRFLEDKILKIGGKIDWLKEMRLTIGRTYHFHKKRRYHVAVDLYRITRSGASHKI
ncbi:TPA: methyltransferase domain-containing protein [Candidatus Bathyarchaeota archaeon]|nr:methyltransferase domain-containing protein [Candidatus Bathyarchaeota archaeon]